MKPLSELTKEVKTIKDTDQSKLALAYANAYIILADLKRELEVLPYRGTYKPVIELRYYEGISGWPNQPYLSVYVPYKGEGQFKVLANSHGYIDVQSSGYTAWYTNDIDRARKQIAKLWVNL